MRIRSSGNRYVGWRGKEGLSTIDSTLIIRRLEIRVALVNGPDDSL
jgi:hypothetical protein